MSRATFVSSRAADEFRKRTAFGAMRLLRVVVFRRCALVGSPSALDRRRIAAPRLRTRHLASWRGTLDGSYERYVVSPMMILPPVAFRICSTVYEICSEKIATGPVCSATSPIFTVFVATVADLPKPTANALAAAACSIWRLLISVANYPSLRPERLGEPRLCDANSSRRGGPDSTSACPSRAPLRQPRPAADEPRLRHLSS